MFSSRPVTLLHSSQIVNNENSTTQTKSAATNTKDPTLTAQKTPTATKSRRAFGDISNKRPQKHHQQEGVDDVPLKAAVARTPATTIVKKSSKKSTKKTSASLFANLDTKKGVSFAEKLESSAIVVPSLPPNAVSAPSETLDKGALDDDDLYDEPEKPLGRTYRQQWENGDHDDDETVLSLEGLDTMVKTWKEIDEKLQPPSFEKEYQQGLSEFDQEIEEFGKQEAATCADFLLSPDESALVSFLDELDDELETFRAADPWPTTTNLDISFG